VSLLREIQNAAVDGSSDLETLLRKCRVLATRLKHEELKKWVGWELDGYPADVPLPAYRKCLGQCFGHFVGVRGRAIKNCPIGLSDIPQEFRDVMSHRVFREGVGGLKNLVDTVDGPTLQFAWPAEATDIVRPRNLADDFVLAQGWINIDKNHVVGILSTVRNRILNFALEIEAAYPDAGEAAPGTTPVPKEVVNQIFNQTFNAPVANVASGHAIQQTGTINIQQGDFRTLATFLKDNGVANEDIQDLETAIKTDPTPDPKTKALGKRVAGWVGKWSQNPPKELGRSAPMLRVSCWSKPSRLTTECHHEVYGASVAYFTSM
jgi:hypothetical protein